MKNKLAIFLVIILISACSSSENPQGVISTKDLSAQTTVTTISQLSNSKDEEIQLGDDVNYCINKYNLWSSKSFFW